MSQGLIDLRGKNALVLGVANDRSLAWAIVKKLALAGATTAFTYGAASNAKRITPLVESTGSKFSVLCDVTNASHWENLKEITTRELGKIDILVHSIAFASPDEISRPLVECSKRGFHEAMEISAYSFIEMVQVLRPLLAPNCSIMTLSNGGSNRVTPGYGIMGVAKAALESAVRYLSYDLGGEGIRVNCISPGPVKTMSAMGVTNFNNYLDMVESKSPLRKNIDADSVAGMAVFLASDLSTHITSSTFYVDAGVHVIGG